jgi:hypothetical protein
MVLYLSFPPALAYNLHSTPANGKQGSIPEEMFLTLLNKKKQGNLDTPPTLLSPRKLALTAEKYTFCVIKSLEQLKN